MSDEQSEPTAEDEITKLFEAITTMPEAEAEATNAAMQAVGQLFEELKRRADADVAAARAAQQHAEIEQARAEERAAGAVLAKEDEARRHAEELRRLEKAYEDRTETLAAASAVHQARAERAEAEADRLREELSSRPER